VLRALLFEVTPHDPLSFAIVVAILGAIALAACWGAGARMPGGSSRR
jgi:hypothetical protein